MELDAYLLFTQCHKLYIQGVRQALRERLESAYEDDWWNRGVILALSDDQRRNLENMLNREPDRELAEMLDSPHFGRIITNHHTSVFSDAFPDPVATFKQFQRLTQIRNEWAHVQSISMSRVMAMTELMKNILASLRRREALEIDEMNKNITRQPGKLTDDVEVEEPTEVIEYPENDYMPEQPESLPLELWRQLQSYLVLDTIVELPDAEPREDKSNEMAQVTLRISNTSPGSEGWPAVHFRSVELEVRGRRYYGNRGHVQDLAPGESFQEQFTFYPRELAAVEFHVIGNLDWNRFFDFQWKQRLPGEIVTPILSEFVERFESIQIEEPVAKALDSIGSIDSTMTLADLVSARNELHQIQPIINRKSDALNTLFKEFHLDREIALGSQCYQTMKLLGQLGSKIQSADSAIGDTDLEQIAQAVHDLEQIRLAILRIENTIKEMTSH